MEIIQSNPKVIVNFTAAWCGPCKMISPQVEQMATELTNVLFIKVDIDDNEESPNYL